MRGRDYACAHPMRPKDGHARREQINGGLPISQALGANMYIRVLLSSSLLRGAHEGCTTLEEDVQFIFMIFPILEFMFAVVPKCRI